MKTVFFSTGAHEIFTDPLRLGLRMIEEIKNLDPTMKIQTIEMLLRVADADPRGIHMSVLQKRMKHYTLSSVSRNVDTLSRVNPKGSKAWGLVGAVDDPVDRRHKIVHLTDKGRRFINDLIQALNGD